jgi:homopolymeric O-antigen transport system permease protein
VDRRKDLIEPSLTGQASPAAPHHETFPVLVLRPAKGWQAIDFKEIWHYRDLLWILGLRDIRVRYKQTALGAAWAILQPVASMVVFTIFFGRLAGIGQRIESGIPYEIYIFTALLPWQLFTNCVTRAGNSVVNSQGLISKVYLPRLIVPMATMASSLVDFLVASAVLVAMMFWYGVVPGPAVLLLPVFVLLAVTAALATSLWLAALDVEYRDVRFVIPFLVQLWMFLSPVVYPTALVPARWRWLYGLNPMAGVIDGFRWALLSAAEPPGPALAVSVAATILLLVGGLYYFRRMERTFADLI